MQFIKPGIHIDFIGKKRYAFILSAVLLLVSLGFTLRGLNFGIDFAGGTIIQVKFDAATPVDRIRDGLDTIGMGGATIQLFGEPEANEYLIRSEASLEEERELSKRVETALAESTNSTPEIRRVEMVGPQVGKDLREKALFAMFYALLFITIYISGRFELQWFKSGVMALCLILAVWLLSRFVSIPWLIVTALIVTLILFWVLQLRYAWG